jgi:hypothetical protein
MCLNWLFANRISRQPVATWEDASVVAGHGRLIEIAPKAVSTFG